MAYTGNICQRWRNLAFTSPHHLNLVLVCRSPNRSAKKILGVWPELPIYVHYLGHTSEEAIDDVVAALRLNYQVSRIRLEQTLNPAWETFAPLMQHPFPLLTHLWVVLPRLGSELAWRAEAGRFATRLTGPILGKVAVPMTVDST